MFEFAKLPCACCGSADARTLGERGGDAHRSGRGLRSTVVRCRGCGHMYPQPMPMVRNPNLLYHAPEEYFAHHDPKAKTARYAALLRVLERRLGRRGRLLDIGSGRGELLCAATALGWRAEGVEASTEFAAEASRASGTLVRCGTLESAAYPAERFDVVTLAAVIEHFYRPDVVMREVHRVLRPGGLVWIDTANEASLYHLMGNAYFRLRARRWVTQMSPTFPPYYVQGFTKRSIATLLELIGFRVEEVTTH